ncbi:MAG: UDP-glucuronic acid decarboxylase family protein [Planctomycetota bacterium]
MMKDTIVVTGGAGFVGSYLCERLYDDGFKIICIDNLITGRLKNLSNISGKADFRFLQQDISEKVTIKIKKLVAILHFASPASPKDYLQYPIETLKTGSFGTYLALELARSSGARFLLASTSEVYGDPLKHPQDETYWGNVNPIGQRSVYDEAKRFAEALTMAYHRKYKIDTKIARIFNTYGPRMRLNDGRALPNFFAQAIKNKDITIYGNGKQTRSFCYIDDMIDGLVKLLWSNEYFPTNLGNPEEISMQKIVQEIIEITESKSKIVYKYLPEDDPQRRKPNINKAKKILKWRPLVSRDVGLIKTLKYFRKEC